MVTHQLQKESDTATYLAIGIDKPIITEELEEIYTSSAEGTNVFEAKDPKKFTNYSEITVRVKRRYH